MARRSTALTPRQSNMSAATKQVAKGKKKEAAVTKCGFQGNKKGAVSAKSKQTYEHTRKEKRKSVTFEALRLQREHAAMQLADVEAEWHWQYQQTDHIASLHECLVERSSMKICDLESKLLQRRF